MTIRKPFFVVPLELENVVTGNARGGHPAKFLGRHIDQGLTWRTSGASNVWARGNFSAAKAIDFCSVMLANALPGTKIRLRLGNSQADVDGSSAPYDSTALDFISPSITREDGLYHSHLELDAVETATWWRIDITGHTGDFEASMLVLGEKIEPSHYYNFDYEQGVEDLGNAGFTEWGVPADTDGLIFRVINFTLGWQTRTEMEAKFRPMMEKLGIRRPVYLCFNPTATTARQAHSYLGRMKKPPFARGSRHPLYMVQEFQILSVA